MNINEQIKQLEESITNILIENEILQKRMVESNASLKAANVVGTTIAKQTDIIFDDVKSALNDAIALFTDEVKQYKQTIDTNKAMIKKYDKAVATLKDLLPATSDDT